MKHFAQTLAACAILVTQGTQALADSTIHLEWNPSPSPTTTGYYICWGSSKGQYDHTNVCGATQTNAAIVVSALGVYYISVKAFDNKGLESDFANEVVYTNSAANAPQLPPIPSTNGTGSALTNSAGSSTNASSSTNAVSTQVTNQQSYVLGIPPSLVIVHTNRQTRLGIWGTLDADIAIQRSTNLAVAAWQTLTNITLTNVVALPMDSLYSQRIYGVLTNAFVPSYTEVTFDDPGAGAPAFHRIEMACDYPILAGKILTAKGYSTRLIMVRMPGVSAHDACYVGSESGFIDSLDNGGLVRFEGTPGPTIRQVAGTVADSVSLHWTSASEFTYSNGMRLLAATVVQTDPPSSDPIAGTNTPEIKIDF